MAVSRLFCVPLASSQKEDVVSVVFDIYVMIMCVMREMRILPFNGLCPAQYSIDFRTKSNEHVSSSAKGQPIDHDMATTMETHGKQTQQVNKAIQTKPKQKF